jgi:hypothetical protein
MPLAPGTKLGAGAGRRSNAGSLPCERYKAREGCGDKDSAVGDVSGRGEEAAV